MRVAVCGILPRSLVFFDSVFFFGLGCGNYKLQRDAFSDSCCSNTRPQGASTIRDICARCAAHSFMCVFFVPRTRLYRSLAAARVQRPRDALIEGDGGAGCSSGKSS